MLTEHARAHFDESVLLFHTIIKRVQANTQSISTFEYKASIQADTAH